MIRWVNAVFWQLYITKADERRDKAKQGKEGRCWDAVLAEYGPYTPVHRVPADAKVLLWGLFESVQYCTSLCRSWSTNAYWYGSETSEFDYLVWFPFPLVTRPLRARHYRQFE